MSAAWLLSGWASTASAQAAPQRTQQCVAAHRAGQEHRLVAELLAARERLQACAAQDCPGVLRQDCEKWLREVEASLPKVVFSVHNPHGQTLVDVRVFADGEVLAEKTQGRPIVLNPGTHRFRLEAPGYAAQAVTLILRPSDQDRVVPIRLTPLSEPTAGSVGVPTATWILGGVSAAGLVGFAAFGLLGKADYDDLRDRCAPDCADEDTAGGRLNYVLADVSLGVSVAAAIAAATVFFVTDRGDEDPVIGGLDAAFTPGEGARMRLTGHF